MGLSTFIHCEDNTAALIHQQTWLQTVQNDKKENNQNKTDVISFYSNAECSIGVEISHV